MRLNFFAELLLQFRMSFVRLTELPPPPCRYVERNKCTAEQRATFG